MIKLQTQIVHFRPAGARDTKRANESEKRKPKQDETRRDVVSFCALALSLSAPNRPLPICICAPRLNQEAATLKRALAEEERFLAKEGAREREFQSRFTLKLTRGAAN